MTGTHQGDFRGIEPTDSSVEIQGNAMHRVRDGRIAETWATWDFLGLLTQVGVVDPPRE
jgi:predicted ester cyclase